MCMRVSGSVVLSRCSDNVHVTQGRVAKSSVNLWKPMKNCVIATQPLDAVQGRKARASKTQKKATDNSSDNNNESRWRQQYDASNMITDDMAKGNTSGRIEDRSNDGTLTATWPTWELKLVGMQQGAGGRGDNPSIMLTQMDTITMLVAIVAN